MRNKNTDKYTENIEKCEKKNENRREKLPFCLHPNFTKLRIASTW